MGKSLFLSNACISLVICTHNPREDYLRRTLKALENQTLPTDRWELLLIDNASNEPLAGKWDLSWHPQARIVREEKVGLTAARLCGIHEARGELLVFVDDDNVLAPDYLQVVCDLFSELPHLGCIGAGMIEPEYEITPPDELLHHLHMLALRSEPRRLWSNSPYGNRPYGAGLAVRKVVAERYEHTVRKCPLRNQLDRAGKDGMNSGGDDEFSFVACEMGLGIGLFPELRLNHLISANRIDRGYLLRIAEGHGFSHAVLGHLHRYSPGLPTASRLADVLRALVRLKLCDTLKHAHTWYEGWHYQTELQNAVFFAWRCGAERARRSLKNSAGE